MQGAIVGYARTSTVDQDAGLEAQIAELKAAGCTRIFAEKVSSVDAQRPKLAEALSFLRDADTFVVTKPDRLARSTLDLLGIVDDLTKRGVNVRLLSMGMDTGTPTGRLVLTVLGAVAEAERNWMLERQRHGIAKAKAEGKYRGRAPTARAKAKEIRALKDEGVAVVEIVRRLKVSRSSVHRILNDRAGQPDSRKSV